MAQSRSYYAVAVGRTDQVLIVVKTITRPLIGCITNKPGRQSVLSKPLKGIPGHEWTHHIHRYAHTGRRQSVKVIEVKQFSLSSKLGMNHILALTVSYYMLASKFLLSAAVCRMMQ